MSEKRELRLPKVPSAEECRRYAYNLRDQAKHGNAPSNMEKATLQSAACVLDDAAKFVEAARAEVERVAQGGKEP